MSFTPQHVVGLPRHYGFTFTGMTGTVVDMVSAPADPTTPGAWVEIIPALPFDTQAVEVQLTMHADSEDSGRWWLGIGPGGSERVVGSFLPFTFGGSGTHRAYLPWGLPSGSRVAVAGHINSTNNPRVSIRVWPRDPSLPAPPQRWRGTYTGPVWNYGTDVPTGLESYDAWTQLISSTPWPVRMLAQTGAGTGGGGSRRQGAAQIAVGAGGSERIVFDYGPGGSSYWGTTSASNLTVTPIPLLPAGVRLSIRSAGVVAGTGKANLLIGG